MRSPFLRRLRTQAFIGLYVAVVLQSASLAANLPPGFIEQPVASGWNAVLGLEFAPDGRLYAGRKRPTVGIHPAEPKCSTASRLPMATTRSIYTSPKPGAAFGDNLRVFDVTAEGQFVLDDLDIYTEVRENTVLIKSFPITVTDGKLNIEFLHVVQNPKVCAIEIVQQ